MKRLKTFFKGYIKELKVNKSILIKSLTSLTGAIFKLLLINKLESMKLYRPISILLKIILKWSAFSTILTVVYTILCSITGFKYDFTFVISVLSAVWVIISEFSIDAVFNIWDKIID